MRQRLSMVMSLLTSKDIATRTVAKREIIAVFEGHFSTMDMQLAKAIHKKIKDRELEVDNALKLEDE